MEMPSCFSFSLWQRLVRRLDGVLAARACFSEIYSRRNEHVDGIDDLAKSSGLGKEVYMAHALLELETNNEPEIALRVLRLAKERFPVSSSRDKFFIRLWMRLLIRLGKVLELREYFQTLIADSHNGALASFSAREQLELFEEYLSFEILTGMTTFTQLTDLRSKRKELVRLAAAESHIAKTSSTVAVVGEKTDIVDVPGAKIGRPDLFEAASNIYSNIGENVTTSRMPEQDCLAKERCILGGKMEALIRESNFEDSMAKRVKKNEVDLKGRMNHFGVPSLIRTLLYKLPRTSNASATNTVDAFVDNILKCTLPPRPPDHKRPVEEADSIVYHSSVEKRKRSKVV